jgi:putative nucleotidyltransferase with HDIG domain
VCSSDLGALNIYSKQPDAFDEAEVKILTEMANDLAYGITALHTRIKHRQAETALQKSVEKLHRTMEETVFAMAKIVETKDPYTAVHQMRVAVLARAIAKEIGFSEDQVNGIYMAALIHDVGKIYVPAEILSKPGRLTEIEFNHIKTHPQVGHDILRTIDFPWPIAEIVRQHHERINGSGYPAGLKGKDILLEARILGVADVVEAMTSRRPYREAPGLKEALIEITQNKGILYEPKVADTCSKLFNKKEFQFALK